MKRKRKKEKKEEALTLVDNQEILTRSARSAKIKGDTSLTRYFSNLKRNGPVIIYKTEFRNENNYFTKLRPNIVLRNPLISVVGKGCVLLVFR